MSTAKAIIQADLGGSLSQEFDKNKLKRLAAKLKRLKLPYKAVLGRARAVTKARKTALGRATHAKSLAVYNRNMARLGAAGGTQSFHDLRSEVERSYGKAKGRTSGAYVRGVSLRRRAKTKGGRRLGTGKKFSRKGRLTSTQYADKNWDRLQARNPYRPGTKKHEQEAEMIKQVRKKFDDMQRYEVGLGDEPRKAFSRVRGKRTISRAARNARLARLEAAGKLTSLKDGKTITRGGKTFKVRTRKAQHAHLTDEEFIKEMSKKKMHPRVIANAVAARSNMVPVYAAKLVETVLGIKMPKKLTAEQKRQRRQERSRMVAVRGAARVCKKDKKGRQRVLRTVTRRNPATGRQFSYKACVLPRPARKTRKSYSKITAATFGKMSASEHSAMKKAAPKTYARFKNKQPQSRPGVKPPPQTNSKPTPQNKKKKKKKRITPMTISPSVGSSSSFMGGGRTPGQQRYDDVVARLENKYGRDVLYADHAPK